MYFRPAKGLTGASLFSLVLLLWLGFWQLDRLEWKENLIANVREGLSSTPHSLNPPEATGASSWEFIGEASEELSYNKLSASGHYHGAKAIFLYATGPEGPGYKVIAPFKVAGGGIILVDRGFVTNPAGVAAPPSEEVEITGLTQLDGRGTVGISGAGEGGIWTYRDVEGMAASLGVASAMPYTIVLLPDEVTTPIPGQPQPLAPNLEFTNNHLSYAVTWFGLAFALICVYIAFHVTQGRLGFGAKEK